MFHNGSGSYKRTITREHVGNDSSRLEGAGRRKKSGAMQYLMQEMQDEKEGRRRHAKLQGDFVMIGR